MEDGSDDAALVQLVHVKKIPIAGVIPDTEPDDLSGQPGQHDFRRRPRSCCAGAHASTCAGV